MCSLYVLELLKENEDYRHITKALMQGNNHVESYGASSRGHRLVEKLSKAGGHREYKMFYDIMTRLIIILGKVVCLKWM